MSVVEDDGEEGEGGGARTAAAAVAVVVAAAVLVGMASRLVGDDSERHRLCLEEGAFTSGSVRRRRKASSEGNCVDWLLIRGRRPPSGKG